MNDLTTVPNTGTFGEAIGKVNTNFLAIKTAIEQLELSVTRSKGFFSSASALTSRYPSPVVGDWAVVQDTSVSPATVYIWRCTTNGTWSNSGTEWPGGNVDLSEYATKANLQSAIDEVKVALNDIDSILNGTLQPIFVKSGYRLNWSSDSNRGYYLSTSGQSVYIFDVTDYKGKVLMVSRRRRENTFHYAFVTDYTLIPSGSADVAIWDSILISGTRCNTTDASETITTSNYTIPSNEGNIYLCVPCFTDTCKVVSTADGLIPLIESKQDALTFDNVPTENSPNPVRSAGIFSEIQPIKQRIYGVLSPIFVKTGYRIIFASTRGYYHATAGQSVIIFDVSNYKGKKVTAKWKRVSNSYSYAFVTDYTLIPTSNNLEQWNSILLTNSGQNSTADSEPQTQELTVPNSENSVYLCLTISTSGGYEVNSNDDSIVISINDLKNGKQDVLTFDNTPTKDSQNPVNSGAIYEAIKPIAGVTGIQIPIFTKKGYRLLYSGSQRGCYYSQASASVVIFDVSDLQGKRISIKQTRQNNAYAYAFVTDYEAIPSSYNLDAWNAIFISGTRETTSATSTYITRTVTVPSNNYDHVYLCVTQINAYPIEVVSLEDIVPPLTVEELQELRKGGSAAGNITYQPCKLGVIPTTSIKYDYNVIIGYGQSLSAGSGFQPEDLPQDDNALMFYLKYSSINSYINSKNLETIKCTGKTSETQDFPPNASATVDFAKLYRLRTGNAEKKFVHICSAQGSMTIAQLMDFARYKTHTVAGSGNFDFPNLDTGYASIRPYQAFQRMLTRLKTIADSEGKTVGVIAVNWNQGEADYGSQSGTPATSTTDYNCNANIEEYTARLRALHDDMWADMQTILGQTEPPVWFVAQCSGQFVKTTFNINQALINICDGKYYFPTHSTYPVPNKDDGHPTGNGYRWYGEYLAKSMADVLLRNNQPELVSVKAIVAKTDSIKLYCQVPNPPLRSEIKTLAEMNNLGFALRSADDSTALIIQSVSIENDVITITPLSELTEGVSYMLHYGTRYATGKNDSSIVSAGNVCDSDAYNANFTCMEEITSAVEYHPLDEDGTPLVGKPYPLYNFLIPFKMEITIPPATS